MIDYFTVAIDLLSSRKPVDSVTSVYLIMFIRNKASLNDLVAPLARVARSATQQPRQQAPPRHALWILEFWLS